MRMNEFDVLDEDECLELLATSDLGRFAVIVDQYPLVFPVNYVLDGNVITFRTAPGVKFDASLNSKVTFEVDHVEPERQAAWSVLVVGSVDRLGMIDAERERVRLLDVRPLAAGDKPIWVRIVPDRITGRRLSAANDEPFTFDLHGYL